MTKPDFLLLAREVVEGKMCNRNALFSAIVEALVLSYASGEEDVMNKVTEFTRVNKEEVEKERSGWSVGYVDALEELIDYLTYNQENDDEQGGGTEN